MVQTSGQPLTIYRVGVGEQAGVVPTTTSSYDARGNLVAQTDANGNRTAWYYDALNAQGRRGQRPARHAAASGSTTAPATPSASVSTPIRSACRPAPALPAPVNAANVRETLFSYDANNRQIESRIVGLMLGRYDEPSGQYRAGAPYGLDKVVVTKQYDAVGNLIKLTDGNGGITYTFYDRAGQKILEVDPEGYGVAWVYGVNGTTTRETRFARRLRLDDHREQQRRDAGLELAGRRGRPHHRFHLRPRLPADHRDAAQRRLRQRQREHRAR